MSAKEKDAVRTTIVGGRPPGSGRNTGTIPRGIEVLVKKAAVDSEFRELLFEQRGAAAAAIELELDPAENAMLNAIPQEQLAQIVGQTTVPVEHRRVFLGRIAMAMLAVLGGGLTGCEPYVMSAGITRSLPPPSTDGIRPDRPPTNRPPLTDGIRPDRPTNAPIQVVQPLGTQGIRPDRPSTNNPPPYPMTKGIQPDRP